MYEINKVIKLDTEKEAVEWCKQNNMVLHKINNNEYIIRDRQYYSTTSLFDLRERRNAECFSVINRGQLWYDTLSDWQIEELKAWYEAWLDVTKTMTIPEKPYWLEV